MITIEKQLFLPDTYPLSRIGALSDLVFFDIETTGFSGDSSNLYLIGCTYYRNKTWNLIQWFADSTDAESDLLRAFFSFLSHFKILLHFNGDGFDIPYLLKRCAALGLNYNFSGTESIDIYKKIRPFKKILGLESLKQKAVERFLGVERTDQFSGGQLINIYRQYLETKSQSLFHLLLLHNEDDLKGMPSILPILNYPDFLTLPFCFDGWELKTASDAFGHEEKSLLLYYKTQAVLPVPMETEKGPFSMTASENRLILQIALREGELKRFYPNYSDYYYLIYEDTAVHKSIGEYVDRSARKKATAKTCYTRAKGIFLPQPSCIFTPCLKEDYSARLLYTPFTEQLVKELSGKKGHCEISLQEPSTCREAPGPLTDISSDRAEEYFRQIMGLFF